MRNLSAELSSNADPEYSRHSDCQIAGGFKIHPKIQQFSLRSTHHGTAFALLVVCEQQKAAQLDDTARPSVRAGNSFPPRALRSGGISAFKRDSSL